MPLHQINVSPIESNKTDNNLGKFGKFREGSARSESQLSNQSNSSSGEICRICHCEGEPETGLIAPCYCSGSLRYVHQVCLQQWIKSSNIRCCELCKFQFIMQTKTKPFTEWEALEMNGFERRKLICAVMFHAIALTCVVWSLYVLIDRTAEEIKHGLLEWPFWTKLIVVAIGFTGGVVFMYIQCKAYMQICQRWKAYNRVIYVQNAPEKPPSPSPVTAIKSQNSSASSDGIGKNQISDKANSKSSNSDNGKQVDETSIDLTGVRNLHIYFNDENQLCVKNNDQKRDGDDAADINDGNSSGQRPDLWHIKIGKGESTSSASLRCGELESIVVPSDQGEQTVTLKPNDDYTLGRYSDVHNSDSVLKLKIKKAEIVIKFGQKSSENNYDEKPNTSSNNNNNNNNNNNDASLNIKIEEDNNKEDQQIGDNKIDFVIDVVKGTVEENNKNSIFNDDNKKDITCDSDDSFTYCPTTNFLDKGNVEAHSETDSGSQSPLLTSKSTIDYDVSNKTERI